MNENPMQGETTQQDEAIIDDILSRDADSNTEDVSTENGESLNLTDPLSMDGTSVNEISIMENNNYSIEILMDVDKIYNLDKIKELSKNKDDNREFLKEAKRQVIEIGRRIEHIDCHTEMFIVKSLIKIGTILNEVEKSYKRKADYMKWFRENFDSHQIRYFQQAKQLARMGKFADENAAVGKNRLLEFDRLRKFAVNEGKSCNEILQAHPFGDIAENTEDTFKEHIDAIITYYRLKNSDIDFIEFEQAELIAAYTHNSILIKTISRIKEKLEGKEDNEKKELFENFVMDMMVIPIDAAPRQPNSLNRLLANINGFFREFRFDDAKRVKDLEDIIPQEVIIDAHNYITTLIEKLNINIESPHNNQLQGK